MTNSKGSPEGNTKASQCLGNVNTETTIFDVGSNAVRKKLRNFLYYHYYNFNVTNQIQVSFILRRNNNQRLGTLGQ